MARVIAVARWPIVRLLLTLLLMSVIATVLQAALRLAAVVASDTSALPALLVLKTTNAAAVLLAYLLMGVFIERKQLAGLGLPLHGLARALGISYVLGGLFISSIIGTLVLLGSYGVAAVALTPPVVQAVLLELVLFLVAAAFEELLYRAVVFRALEESLGTWLAIGISAVLFGLAHVVDNPGFTVAGILSTALVPGVLLSAAFVLTRNLWYVIGFHWGFNFLEAAIFGVRVSGSEFVSIITPTLSGDPLLTGGQFGPEAGIQAVVLGVLINVVLLHRLVKERKAITPGWLKRALH